MVRQQSLEAQTARLILNLVYFLTEVQGASTATVATVICLMMLITVAGCLATFYITRRRYLLSAEEALNKTTTTTASFDSYPNQYSSLPTKDVSTQRASHCSPF